MYDHAGLKVHVIPCAFAGAEAGGWFAKEIKTSSDLEGLRMRIFGLGGRVMSRAGAVTMLVPGGDLEAAFAKNKIDAAELYTPAVDERLGIKDKVKLIYQPGWQQPETVLELLINKDRWDALSAGDRALIDGACRDTLQATLADSARLQTEALDRMKSENGVRVEQMPQAVLSALHSAWEEVAKEEGDRRLFLQDRSRGHRQVRQGGAKELRTRTVFRRRAVVRAGARVRRGGRNETQSLSGVDYWVCR